jgi:F-type H+-transporting ATPase subunit delta
MAAHTDALAQVYARSLFELAAEAGGQDKIAEIGGELEQIAELGRGDRHFREFLASPIIEREKRGAALAQIFRDQVSDLTLRFLLVLNVKGRLGHLESINTAYDQLLQDAYGRVEVDLYTAAPLGEEVKSLIAERIQGAIGREPVLHAYTDPAMLGGIKLRMGDQLIDGSVAARLRRLRHALLTQGSARLRDGVGRIVEGGNA